MEQDKRLLFIGDSGFMVNSIKKELQNSGIDIVQVSPDINALQNMEDKPNVYLLYIENADEILKIALYLMERVVEDDISINIIGSHDDLERLNVTMPKERITAVFERPVNVKELASSMLSIIEKEKSRNVMKRILVVDDDGTMLRTIKTWLSDKYQVFMANSGMSAITFLAKKEVDLILLDYEMPITNGPQVLEMLKSDAHTQSIPVMFLTNKSDKESVMNVLSLKPEKYLLKTMPKNELIANIDDFFEREKIKKLIN